MKNIYLLLILIMASTAVFAGDAEGYNIKVKINGLQNVEVYLAHHFGENKYMSDTTMLDENGEGAFTGSEKLKGGLYLVVLPPRTYFEIIINEDQEFLIENDTSDFVRNFSSFGSTENRIFYEDIRFIGSKQTEKVALQNKLKDQPKNETLKDSINARLAELDKEVIANRKNIIAEYPNTLYAKVLGLLQDVEVPEPPRDDKGELIDSFFEYRYKKAHYFDNVNFADDRLLRTPILLQKVNVYLDNWVSPDPDSIIVVVDRILDEAIENDDSFWFWAVTLLNRYANSKIMGQDAVFVHIVMKHYKTGHAFWTSKADSMRIVTEAEAKSKLLIGKKAPNFRLKDPSGKYYELNNINAEYVLLFFYSDECGHCKKETPKLVALYDSLKTQYDIEVLAINTENIKENWVSFIEKHGMKGWINLADIELQNYFRSNYHIKSTPQFYLLDKDKIIRGNRFNTGQLRFLLERLDETLNKEQPKSGSPILSDDVIIE